MTGVSMRAALGLTLLGALVLVLEAAPLGESTLVRAKAQQSVWNGDIYVVNVNGSGSTRLTWDPAEEFDPAWSPDGSKIVYSRFTDSRFQLWVIDADGTNTMQLTDADASAFDAAWSPDGRKIAFARCRGSCDIYTMNADGSGLHQVTHAPPPGERDPTWSPDGLRIAFADVDGIFVVDARGGDWQRVTVGPADDASPSWSPVGPQIAFESTRDLWDDDIYLVRPDGGRLTNLTDGSPLDFSPSWSPDGKRIAFMRKRNRYERARVFVMDPDGSFQASLGAIGDEYSRPSWSPDGMRIAYSWLRACVVPKVAGMKLQDARERIRRASCAVGQIRFKRSRGPRGIVVSQKPAPHATRPIGASVRLAVSVRR